MLELFKDRPLKGKRVAILAADGFEVIELKAPLMGMRAAGAKVDVVSLRTGRIRGVNVHEPGMRQKVTHVIDQVTPDEYDALFIPGGLINPDMLRQSEKVRSFVKTFNDADKPIAVICHAAWVLASAEILKGRTLTSWPGIRDDMIHAGAIWVNEPVVREGNILSSRGPQDIVPFVKELTKFFAGQPTTIAETTEAADAPKAIEPPQLMLQTMKWLPRPSFRTAALFGLALLGGMISKKANVTG